MKLITVLGARPQFIKAAVVSRQISLWNARGEDLIQEVIVHTGQHFDHNMSQVFFDELGIPAPNYNLQIKGGRHGASTGMMLQNLEEVLISESPDMVLVYGDTNSTLAGALAAAKLHIPVVHVEAGLRSFNKHMPEEINRVLTDHLSALLLCPTQNAVLNLQAEGIINGVYNTGDVMFDASLYYRDMAATRSTILNSLKLASKEYALSTCHRAENTDDPERLREILTGLSKLAEEMPVVLPLHPRTAGTIRRVGLEKYTKGIRLIEPVPYLDMVQLEENARLIVTDSGGVQKEAYFFQVPCITLRDETEWIETVKAEWNVLVGASAEKLIAAASSFDTRAPWTKLYGNGQAGLSILNMISQQFF